VKAIRKYILLFCGWLPALAAGAQQYKGIPDRPMPPRLVNNLSEEFPDFLSGSEETQLEQKLEDFANQTSNQIVVVITDDIAGLEAWDYATRLGHKWGVGQKKFDNGIVILIKPTGGEGQRDAHIAVGYGLEGAIPDATANQVVDNELAPLLADGKPYEALDKTTTVLMDLAKGEYDSDAYAKKHKRSRGLPVAIIAVIIIAIIFSIGRRGGGRGGMTIGRRGPFYWGGFGGFGGWGGGGGGSSGGFGGFGGGGFGGGGAGSKW